MIDRADTISKSQRDALLNLLSRDDVEGMGLDISNRNRGRFVSFQTAESLRKRGLVRAFPVGRRRTRVRLTDAGRRLARRMKR